MSTVDMSCRMDYIKQRTEKRQDEKVSGGGARGDAGGQRASRENMPESSTFGRSMADAREAADGEVVRGTGKAAAGENPDMQGKAVGASAGGAERTGGNTGNAAGDADKTAGAGGPWAAAKSPQDMSQVEYIQYINSWIAELSRRNHNRNRDVFIYISEEGYRAMQNDPEYEAWVMQNIREAYGYSMSWCGHDADYHSVHLFGASKEEYRGQTWSSGCRKCEDKRRQEQKLRRKKQLKAYLKKQQEKKRLERIRLEKLHIEKEVYKKLLAKRRLDRDRLAEEQREEALARREAASALRMYMAALKYSEQ